MGNSSSACLDDYLNDLALAYPNAEVELEAAYNSCTQNGKDVHDLFYANVEPVIRHILYNMGAVDVLSEITSRSGALDLDQITPMFEKIGLEFQSNQPLLLDDWKILLIAWVRRIQEIQKERIQKWDNCISQMQYEQQQKFNLALQQFRKSYIDQIYVYYDQVEKQIAAENKYREAWQTQQSVREEFANTQVDYIKRMNEEASHNFKLRELQAQQQNYLEIIKAEARKIKQTPFEGAKKVYTYTYPCSMHPTGAPISGGAPLPRPRK